MSKKTIKNEIRKILHYFGYQVSRTADSPLDAFVVQSNLIKKIEPVVFDVGAHIGGVTEEYRNRFPLASIYCFEPFPQAFQILSTNEDKDSRTFCYQVALSDKKGTAVFNSNRNATTNSLLTTDERGASFWGEGVLETASQCEVNTTTIDIFCQESSISHVDILKMDVQGAEFTVLDGARRMLADQRISIIYTEVIICPTYKGQHRLHEYMSLLDSFGYEFLDFFNPVRKDGKLIQADLVFLSSSFNAEIQNR